jgi:phage-related protein
VSSVHSILLDVVGKSDDARRNLQQVAAAIREIPNAATVRVKADIGEADAKLSALKEQLRSIDREKVSPNLDVCISGALAKIEVLQARLRKFGGGKTSLTFDARGNLLKDLAGMEQEVQGLTKGLVNASEQGGAFGGAMGKVLTVLKSMTPVLAGLGILVGFSLVSSVAALAASFGAAIAGVGALATALVAVLGPAALFVIAIFKRVAAVMGAKAAQDNAAKQSAVQAGQASRRAASDAEAEHNAALAVRDARQAQAQAETQLAAAIDSARQKIKDAARAEADANRTVADAVRSRAQAYRDLLDARKQAAADIATAGTDETKAHQGFDDAVTQGRRDVADAQGRLNDANDNLAKQTTAAWKDWDDTINKVKHDTLDVVGAQLDLEDAQAGVTKKQKALDDMLASFKAPPELKQLTDVNLDPNVAKQLLATASAAGQISPDEAAKLAQAYRDLERAQNDAGKAGLDLSDANKTLADDQSKVDTYTRDGINAYGPYADALKGAHDAQQGLDDAIAASGRNIADAKGQWDDARSKLARLQQQGIEGNPQVVNAEDQLHGATERLTNARRDEHDAEAALLKLRAQGVAKAPEVISAENSLRDARQRLTEALHDQRHAGQQADDQAAAGASAAAAAAYEVGKLSAAEKDLLGALREVGKAWKAAMGPGTDLVIAAIAGAIRDLVPLFKQTEPLFTALGATLAGGINEAAKALRDPAWTGFFKDVGVALIQIAGDGLRAFGHLAELFRNIAHASLPFLVSAFSGVADALGSAAKHTSDLDALRSIIGTLVRSTKAWLDLFGGVADVTAAFVGDIGPMGDGLVRWLTQGAHALADWMRSAKGSATLKRFFADTLPFAKELVKFIGQLAIALLQVFQFLAPALTATFKGLNLVLGVINWLLSLANKLPTPIKELLGSILLMTGPIGKAQKAFELFGREMVVSGRAAIAVLDVLGHIGQDIVDGISAGLSAVVDAIVGPFKDAVNAVLAFLGIKSPSTVFRDIGGDVVRGFINGMKSLPGDVVAVGKWLIERISEGLHTIGGLLEGWAGWLRDRLVNAVSAGADLFRSVGHTVIGWLTDGIQTIGGTLNGFAGWLRDRVVNALAAGVDLFKAAGHAVIGWLTEGVQTIGGTIDGFAGWLRDRLGNVLNAGVDLFKAIGHDVLSWLIDGLLHAPQKVWDALKGFADKIVEEVKKFLHIKSPSKRFVKIGEQMAAGLVKGFTDTDPVAFIEGALGGIKHLAVDIGKAGLKDLLHLPGKALKKLHLPHLASGGLASAARAVVVGDGPSDEAILPLTDAVFRSLAEGITDQLRMSMPNFQLQPPGDGAGGDTYNLYLPASAPAAPQPDPDLAAADMVRVLRARGGLRGVRG